MSLFDEDPAVEAEKVAAQWAAYHAAVKQNVHDVREHLVAIAVARLIGEDEGPATVTCDLRLEQIQPDMLIDMLQDVLWYGCLSAEQQARGRLHALREFRYVDTVPEFKGYRGRHVNGSNQEG